MERSFNHQKKVLTKLPPTLRKKESSATRSRSTASQSLQILILHFLPIQSFLNTKDIAPYSCIFGFSKMYKYERNRLTTITISVVVAQLIERLLSAVRIQSSAKFILNICLLSIVYWEDKNKEKEAGNGPFFLKKLYLWYKSNFWYLLLRSLSNFFGRHTFDQMARWQKEKWWLTEKFFN